MSEKEKPELDESHRSGAPDNTEASAASPQGPPDELDEPKIIYRRVDLPETNAATSTSSESVWRREISPAIVPLVIGFLLLLILILTVSYISINRMGEVGRTVLSLEEQHAARLSYLLKLRLAVTKLNNEVRARADADSRGGLKPPFDVRLNTARGQLNDLLRQIRDPTLLADPAWQKLRTDLQAFMEVADDLERYSLEGYAKFKIVDKELDELLGEASEAQSAISQQSETLEMEAARSIRTWAVIAVIVGALVAAGTIWEIQRRFNEMRRSVDEARRERVFTSQLLEGMVSAVAAIDENDRIRSANAAFFRIFPRATIGASVYEKFASEPAMKMLEAATATLVDRAAYRGRWVCPPGEDCDHEQAFDVYSSPLAINGAHGQILTLVDVTEAAEAERGLRRQESLAAVGQATAQVAHEIRNPLGSIRLGVSMLRDSISDPEGLSTIELVERGIKHLSKLVVDVAQFSRRKALEQVNVNLHELLDHSLELVSSKIQDKETPIEKRFTAQELVGHWDPDQLSQVFVNVIANAIDASPKRGTVKISTEVIQVASENDDHAFRRRALVKIVDEGVGMDAQTAERIFEPFFSTKKRGTGLGLAIVKQIVEQHDGTITAESELGKGTTFRIELPL